MRQPPAPGERVAVELSPGVRGTPAVVVAVAYDDRDRPCAITVDVGPDDDAQSIVTLPPALVHSRPDGPFSDRSGDGYGYGPARGDLDDGDGDDAVAQAAARG